MKSFENIIGYEGAKRELYQIIDMFKEKEKYVEMGAKLPKGVLIYGAPGLGKTMLAEAMINECGVKSFTIKNNKIEVDLIKEINSSFAEAAKLDKAIIFLDDLDKYSECDREDCDARVFVNIQANIDSIKNKDIFIIATVNDIRKLPSSLKRNGRFDRKIKLESPTNEDAAKIIQHYIETKRINPNLNFEDVTKMINYTSCADLETVLNESAILAAFEGKDSIDINDIVTAYVRDQYDVPKENLECSQEEMESTALHEAGHIVVAESLKEGSVGFATIQPTSKHRMNGFTHICDEFRRRPEHILTGLGGKVACEQFLQGRCASGCQNDLFNVIRFIQGGIKTSGTAGVGMLDAGYAGEYLCNSYNDTLEAVTKAEIERYIFRVKEILFKNKEFLFELAEELKNKKFLLYSDIRRIRSMNTVTCFQA